MNKINTLFKTISFLFKVNLNEYLYPVDALLAFKEKDWNKLKELRQKMPEEII